MVRGEGGGLKHLVLAATSAFDSTKFEKTANFTADPARRPIQWSALTEEKQKESTCCITMKKKK
jgi:hypothetical protein